MGNRQGIGGVEGEEEEQYRTYLDDDHILSADLERVSGSLQEEGNSPRRTSTLGSSALEDAINQGKTSKSVTAKLATIMAQLRAVVGFPIRVDYGGVLADIIPPRIPQLPLEDTAKLLNHCHYTISYIDNIPEDKRDPGAEELVGHFSDIK